MIKQEYKKVVDEAKMYIEQGKPIAAAHVFEQHEHKFTHRQYYDLMDLIYYHIQNK